MRRLLVLLVVVTLSVLLGACNERSLARLAADWCRHAGSDCDYHGESDTAR